MALQFEYTLSNTSLVAPAAYAKIDRIVCVKNADSESIEIRVSIFSTVADREAEKDAIYSIGAILSSDKDADKFAQFFPNGVADNNLFEKSYEYLKTLLLFVDAIDV